MKKWDSYDWEAFTSIILCIILPFALLGAVCYGVEKIIAFVHWLLR